MITLQPIAMVVFNSLGIYAPSRLRKQKKLMQQEFLEKFADHPISIQVSFEADGISNPQTLTAYGYGLDCLYVVQ